MAESETKKNAQRYERLRVLGAAPYGSKHLDNGEVLRFTNLDEFVDKDLDWVPSRGEAQPMNMLGCQEAGHCLHGDTGCVCDVQPV